jgi:hypothetical protein
MGFGQHLATPIHITQEKQKDKGRKGVSQTSAIFEQFGGLRKTRMIKRFSWGNGL